MLTATFGMAGGAVVSGAFRFLPYFLLAVSADFEEVVVKGLNPAGYNKQIIAWCMICGALDIEP